MFARVHPGPSRGVRHARVLRRARLRARAAAGRPAGGSKPSGAFCVIPPPGGSSEPVDLLPGGGAPTVAPSFARLVRGWVMGRSGRVGRGSASARAGEGGAGGASLFVSRVKGKKETTGNARAAPLMACCSFRRSPGRSLSTSISSISSTGSFSYSTSNASAAILAWSAVSLMGGGRSSSSSSPGVSFAFSAEDDARTVDAARGTQGARAAASREGAAPDARTWTRWA